ncbi:cadmium/zinc/cobalt-transporting ATPase [Marinicella pacifica]|uniref:P-type Zn(2+) transporter n=1 Tax=Marinicella pacifica TaxID=1171543 RepID=A0A917FRU2_9GAMM|nr:heavy metal translocating P-type ATPase [Marinicella pacifica]GGG02364.1 cadmium/zinc/cobalt-transporting ATPase [Marinicella pacifica]
MKSHKEQKSHDLSGHEGHNHDYDRGNYIPSIVSLSLLLLGLALEHIFKPSFFQGWVMVTWYIAAYLPVALPVIKETIEALKKGEVFTEFFLMTIATIGAMAIGEYPEGVAVMLFYAIGELFQNAAVNRAKKNITALLDVRPKTAHVLTDGNYQTVDPESVKVGDTIQIKVGEKVPLDGKLISDKASLNAAAITGESKPQSLIKGENVLAGSINLESVIEVEVEKLYNDSSVAKILNLVQNATAKKAKTELLIRRLAKIYTPIVVYLAIAICILPYFFVETYQFQDWLYRALIFLVISCPCALVISIPLGYFGGLGAASKNGILFKGATFMDTLIQVNTLVMDKTGTVTKGTFKVKEINISNDMTEDEFMSYVLSLEKTSTHPIAKAIMQYENAGDISDASDVDEIAGKGLKGVVKNKTVLAGNKKLLDQFNIKTPGKIDSIVDSIVLVAIEGDYAGCVTISDELKDDANQTILSIRNLGINEIVMLSGDKDSITQKVAGELSISQASGGLLPEDKLNHVEKLKEDPTKVIAFMGDGINDAPVLATSHLGIAMGANGSDVAIETADMIIQTDQPSKFITGFNISKSTQQVIWQNIILAFGVKVLVLILGAAGMATLWQAVFADVGVALLAILNAVRLQKMKW